ncbi:hypothetical protein BKA93DRAFT_821973 [Sparassis latifolia]
MEKSNGNDQSTFTIEQDPWRVNVSRHWNVLGPFPIHAREQHFLSPSFPLNLAEPLDLDARFPSSYADGGDVGWSAANYSETGTLEVSFPDIRWTSLRATEGWAALQHHTVLHASITVYPPSAHVSSSATPHLLVEVLRGSFFTVLPSRLNESSDPVVPVWYAGNVYALGSAPPQAVALPVPPSITSPTSYDLLISGDYEIRLFGDPGYDGSTSRVPVLSVTVFVDIEAETPVSQFIREPSHDVACDFVNGWAFGEALGVGVRSVSGWWTIKSVRLTNELEPDEQIEVSLVNEMRIAPTQTRIVPIRLSQRAPFYGSDLCLELILTTGTLSTPIQITIPIIQHPLWTASVFLPTGIQASYFFGISMATAFLVIPPKQENPIKLQLPLLALHGAGVDIFSGSFWIEALPRQEHSWVIAPTGRTAWGLDWHGPSSQDAWGTVDALHTILNARECWHPWMLAEKSRVLVLGHSNGGQGTWYMASRYPDRVAAAIPAAAYIKSQSYVPLTQSRYAHFIDPSVRAILESSLTPDDNDLFLSNLVDTPILAIHGGDDENVPVWHTREAVSVLKTWNPQANVTYREDLHEPHWYPSVFSNEGVQEFIRSILENKQSLQASSSHPSQSFTLTVSIPSESGSLHGWQIHRLDTPGRLAKLTVEVNNGAFIAKTTNVRVFSIHRQFYDQLVRVTVDGILVPINFADNDVGVVYFLRDGGMWTVLPNSAEIALQAHGRMARVLSSAAPLTIIIPNEPSCRTLSSALRIAHILDVYHKLDAEIIVDAEAMRRLGDNSLGQGNIVVIGGANGEFSRAILLQNQTAFSLQNGSLCLHGRLLSISSTALFLHSHPVLSTGLMLFIYALDESGLERGIRLFPTRTGVTLPDFLVIGPQADTIGAGAVEATGVWGDGWDWNSAMSSF